MLNIGSHDQLDPLMVGPQYTHTFKCGYICNLHNLKVGPFKVLLKCYCVIVSFTSVLWSSHA